MGGGLRGANQRGRWAVLCCVVMPGTLPGGPPKDSCRRFACSPLRWCGSHALSWW